MTELSDFSWKATIDSIISSTHRNISSAAAPGPRDHANTSGLATFPALPTLNVSRSSPVKQREYREPFTGNIEVEEIKLGLRDMNLSFQRLTDWVSTQLETKGDFLQRQKESLRSELLAEFSLLESRIGIKADPLVELKAEIAELRANQMRHESRSQATVEQLRNLLVSANEKAEGNGIRALEAEVERLRSRCEEDRAEVLSLRSRCERSVISAQTTEESSRATRMELTSVSSEILGLTDKVRSLTEAVARQGAALAKAESSLRGEGSLSSMAASSHASLSEGRLRSLEAVTEELKRQITVLKIAAVTAESEASQARKTSDQLERRLAESLLEDASSAYGSHAAPGMLPMNAFSGAHQAHALAPSAASAVSGMIEESVAPLRRAAEAADRKAEAADRRADAADKCAQGADRKADAAEREARRALAGLSSAEEDMLRLKKSVTARLDDALATAEKDKEREREREREAMRELARESAREAARDHARETETERQRVAAALAEADARLSSLEAATAAVAAAVAPKGKQAVASPTAAKKVGAPAAVVVKSPSAGSSFGSSEDDIAELKRAVAELKETAKSTTTKAEKAETKATEALDAVAVMRVVGKAVDEKAGDKDEESISLLWDAVEDLRKSLRAQKTEPKKPAKKPAKNSSETESDQSDSNGKNQIGKRGKTMEKEIMTIKEKIDLLEKQGNEVLARVEGAKRSQEKEKDSRVSECLEALEELRSLSLPEEIESLKAEIKSLSNKMKTTAHQPDSKREKPKEKEDEEDGKMTLSECAETVEEIKTWCLSLQDSIGEGSLSDCIEYVAKSLIQREGFAAVEEVEKLTERLDAMEREFSEIGKRKGNDEENTGIVKIVKENEEKIVFLEEIVGKLKENDQVNQRIKDVEDHVDKGLQFFAQRLATVNADVETLMENQNPEQSPAQKIKMEEREFLLKEMTRFTKEISDELKEHEEDTTNRVNSLSQSLSLVTSQLHTFISSSFKKVESEDMALANLVQQLSEAVIRHEEVLKTGRPVIERSPQMPRHAPHEDDRIVSRPVVPLISITHVDSLALSLDDEEERERDKGSALSLSLPDERQERERPSHHDEREGVTPPKKEMRREQPSLSLALPQRERRGIAEISDESDVSSPPARASHLQRANEREREREEESEERDHEEERESNAREAERSWSAPRASSWDEEEEEDEARGRREEESDEERERESAHPQVPVFKHQQSLSVPSGGDHNSFDDYSESSFNGRKRSPLVPESERERERDNGRDRGREDSRSRHNDTDPLGASVNSWDLNVDDVDMDDEEEERPYIPPVVNKPAGKVTFAGDAPVKRNEPVDDSLEDSWGSEPQM